MSPKFKQRVERGLYEQKNQATTVGVDVSYDIFTGGRKVSRIAEAKHSKRQAEYKRIETERNVIADVRQALIGLKAAQKQLMRQRAASERVQMNRDLVELEFQAGKAPLVRLNQGQRDLVEAQGDAALSFRLAVPAAEIPFRFQVFIISDAAPLEPTLLFEINQTHASVFSKYQRVEVDASAYANGGAYTLRFSFTSDAGDSNARTAVFLDDVFVNSDK